MCAKISGSTFSWNDKNHSVHSSAKCEKEIVNVYVSLSLTNQTDFSMKPTFQFLIHSWVSWWIGIGWISDNAIRGGYWQILSLAHPGNYNILGSLSLHVPCFQGGAQIPTFTDVRGCKLECEFFCFQAGGQLSQDERIRK